MSPTDNKVRRAALDVGSNSVRLLVADVAGRQAIPVYREKITCRLLSGFADGLLAPDALARTREAIARLTARAREMGAAEIVAFGTSAMRDGRNAGELIDGAAKDGVTLKVISGVEEAEAAFRGAAPSGYSGVIDIGGGSTEVLAGRDGRVLEAYSARVGAVRLREAAPDAPPEELLSLAREALLPAASAVRGRPPRWVGVGGTITTLAAIKLGLTPYDPERIERARLTPYDAREALFRLHAMPLEARRRVPGLNPERADILPAGLAVLTVVMALFCVDCLQATDKDNLLGALLD